ncbi:MAG: peptidase M48 [Cyclobacteriaceae bacterium]|nr:MAG: peptidase M48 [Cyclobacteriaceae bacterium]
MSADTILYIIVAILVVNYLWEQLLDLLNLNHQKDHPPKELADVCDQATYRKTLAYHRAQTKFGFVSSAISFVALLVLLLTGAFGELDSWLHQYIDNEILLALSFFGILFLVADILSIPLQWYNTFVLEEKFGFNKTTVPTFWLDKLKGYLLAAVLAGPLVWLLLFLIDRLGPAFWIYFVLAIGLFSLFLNVFYTSLILPLFNKLTPLPDGELKRAIEVYASKVSFPLSNILVIDGSKRSSKSNAFFSGIGKKKKIVLYDTLIENHSIEELVSILAHEVGHYRKKHVIQNFVLSLIQSAVMMFLLSRMITQESLSLALGAQQTSIHLNLLAFGMLYAPVSKLLGVFLNILSRKNEFQADAFAAKTADKSALASALKNLSVDNLSNLWPHHWFVFFHYSHPPLVQRLRALDLEN